ncbi:MAG: hypothetical protein SFX74_09715 [Fimbriimonadaceae bacterium]|nr:hypothetical protein [Fimbriimonadaceae bacterium]
MDAEPRRSPDMAKQAKRRRLWPTVLGVLLIGLAVITVTAGPMLVHFGRRIVTDRPHNAAAAKRIAKLADRLNLPDASRGDWDEFLAMLRDPKTDREAASGLMDLKPAFRYRDELLRELAALELRMADPPRLLFAVVRRRFGDPSARARVQHHARHSVDPFEREAAANLLKSWGAPKQ